MPSYTGAPLDLYLPDVGENGWGTLMSQNLQRMHDQASLGLFDESDFTFHADSSGYYARDERFATQPYTSPTSLHAVVNPAMQSLNGGHSYNGSGDGFWNDATAGGSAKFARPVGGVPLVTDQELFVYTSQYLFAGYKGCIIQASNSFTNTGTEANGLGFVISVGWGTNMGDVALHHQLRGIVVDCNGRATGPFLYRRRADASGYWASGANGKSEWAGLEGYNMRKHGLLVGLSVDTAGGAGSSNLWTDGCFLHDGLAGSQLFKNNTGDVHTNFCNFVQQRLSGSKLFEAAQLACVTRDCHIGWQGGDSSGGRNPADDTPAANYLISGGGGHFLIGLYVDNAGGNGQAAVEITGGNAITLAPCRLNWSDSDTTRFPSAKAVCHVGGSQSYVGMSGWQVNGPTATVDGAELMRVGSGAAPTAMLNGNRGRGVKGFFQGSFKPAQMGANQITSTLSGITQSNDEILSFTGAGATPNAANYVQLYDGMEAWNETDLRRFLRMNGAWRKSAAYT